MKGSGSVLKGGHMVGLRRFVLPMTLLVLLIAHSMPSGGEGEPGCIRVTDQLGRAVNLKRIPGRIVSLAPSNTEVLFALGLGDKVVGVTELCDYPPEAMKKERVGTFMAPDVEKIVALAPDLILATSMHRGRIIPELEKRGFVILGLSPHNLEEVFQGLRLVGQVTGSQRAISEIVGRMRARVRKVLARVEECSQIRPRVLLVVWHDPLWTAGQGTVVHDLISKAGGANVFGDLNGFGPVDLELVVERDPQVIIVCTGHGAAKGLPFRWAKAEPRLEETEARRLGRIYQIDADLITRPGPRAIDALELFARFIHPEIFSL